MSIEVKCECGSTLRAPNRMIGKAARCSSCNRRLIVMPTDRDEAARLLARVAGEQQDEWIRTSCHRCGKRIKAPSKWKGRKGRCPRCNADVIMGQQAPESPEAPELPPEKVAAKSADPAFGDEASGPLDEDAIVDTIEAYIRDREGEEDEFEGIEQAPAKVATSQPREAGTASAAGVPEATDAGESGVLDASGLADLYAESFGQQMGDSDEPLPEGQLPEGPELLTEEQRNQLVRDRAHQQKLAKLKRRQTREYRKYQRLKGKRPSYRLLLLKEQLRMQTSMAGLSLSSGKGALKGVVIVVLALGVVANAWFFLLGGEAPSQVTAHYAYFYDMNSGELFTQDVDQTAPVEAPSGPLEVQGKATILPAGVRAHVFSCGDCENASSRWVGYIELDDMSTKESQMLVQVGAMASDGAKDEMMLVSESAGTPHVSDPEVVRWVPADSPEAQNLYEAMSEQCGGRQPDLCMPEPRVLN